VPAFTFYNGTTLTIVEMFRNIGYDSLFIGGLADEIEQLAKLLPPDYRKPSTTIPQSRAGGRALIPKSPLGGPSLRVWQGWGLSLVPF
jgi:hypothetical protein